jgi:cyclopropane fatty-acyl-phospholipid synthase-like methyltransferase
MPAINAKRYSEACERNCAPILAILKQPFAASAHVLEIGSGTGQHAVHFAAALPHLLWQTSDLPEHHASILAWQVEAGLSNVLAPLALNVAGAWPPLIFDAAFTANTCHIMAWPEVEAMFAGVGRLLPSDGVFCVYGPFNRGGDYTSPSNARFDEHLRAQAAHMGIRDVEKIEALAAAHGLRRAADHAMPANNRLLVWEKLEKR